MPAIIEHESPIQHDDLAATPHDPECTCGTCETNDALGYDADVSSPSQYCKHGTFIGSWWGPDYLCGLCEDGRDLRATAIGIRETTVIDGDQIASRVTTDPLVLGRKIRRAKAMFEGCVSTIPEYGRDERGKRYVQFAIIGPGGVRYWHTYTAERVEFWASSEDLREWVSPRVREAHLADREENPVASPRPARKEVS